MMVATNRHGRRAGRAAEVVNLKPDDIHCDRMVIHVRQGNKSSTAAPKCWAGNGAGARGAGTNGSCFTVVAIGIAQSVRLRPKSGGERREPPNCCRFRTSIMCSPCHMNSTRSFSRTRTINDCCSICCLKRRPRRCWSLGSRRLADKSDSRPCCTLGTSV